MKTKGFFEIVCLVLILTVFLASGCKGPQIGLNQGGLRPCPPSPNCVTSMGGDGVHSVDPMEFWLPKGERIIHVRSCARLGYWDFGVNRKRVEKITALFLTRHVPDKQ